jgi:hypothetical protein
VSTILVGLIIFACFFGGALLGMALRLVACATTAYNARRSELLDAASKLVVVDKI